LVLEFSFAWTTGDHPGQLFKAAKTLINDRFAAGKIFLQNKAAESDHGVAAGPDLHEFGKIKKP